MKDVIESRTLHYTMLRIAIGIVFVVAGASKTVALFSGDTGVQLWIVDLLKDTFVPQWAALLGGYLMPFAELALGIALLFGILTYLASSLGILMFATFLFVAEMNHAAPGMLMDIIQQIVFVITLFLLAQFNPKDKEFLALVKMNK